MPLFGTLPTIAAIRASDDPYAEDFKFFKMCRGGLSYFFIGSELQLRVQDADLLQEVGSLSLREGRRSRGAFQLIAALPTPCLSTDLRDACH